MKKLTALAALALFAACVAPRPAEPANSKDVHDPANAVANLDIHPGLQATLFASEPALTNPTNCDIDARGRVWLCDVQNYRGNNGKRPAGDRILILEDTTGTGRADKVKTFYQGRDVDSAMGICVLGNKLIVSSSPNVLLFTFDENDKILKKEVLFSRTGMPQHDHSAHTFVFGPDGRLYWNFGNTGQSVHDRDGKVITDLAGNPVVDNGKPYFGGMVFRCEPDGSHFEVLAHNFRNDYEVCVDSFGTIWQSDNDDDGNRGVRILYVMEYGNYGYRDEMTGAGWQTPRTNMEAEIPLRHWHLNDPGVVPNLLQTGAGSPTGITVYEGEQLPQVFRNQVIHCDAGPSIVRAYPVTKDGAGYKASIVNMLDGERKNNWFRPVDPRTAPDGSLFITDWYDPGVGGHGQRDLDRGRVFRVSAPGKKYEIPKYDYSTAEGATEALKNPCSSVRYLAWTALHGMGAKAEPALLKLWHDPNPRYRARALWLLGRIEGKGQHYVDLALHDGDPDLRITGLRLARQLGLDLVSVVRTVVRDASPQVRRDAAIALRHVKTPEAATLWAELAQQHDGKDRWYLEALGIGADQQWNAYLEAWLKQVGDGWNTPAGRDVIWRSRAAKTPEYLARILADPSVPMTELPRYFRAFDFQKADGLNELLARLAFTPTGDAARQDLVTTESLTRLKHFDVKKHPEYVAALDKLLEHHQGTGLYVELVDRFGLTEHLPELLVIAQKNAEGQVGVNAVRVLLDRQQMPLFEKALHDADAQKALDTAKALGSAADDRANAPLLAIVRDGKQSAELRRQAVKSLARSRRGANEVLKLARAKQLPEELNNAASYALHQAPWRDVKQQAVALFPLPADKNNQAAPPIGELVHRRGDANRGKVLFNTTGTCATCHLVNGTGKEVGPDLSEIGKKLSRESLYESILYPSASIAHNYETYVLETKDGNLVTGLLVSDTPEGVTLKGNDALVRTFKRSKIDSLKKSPVSLMPADLYKVLSSQELVDVVEYLQTLKEAQKPK